VAALFGELNINLLTREGEIAMFRTHEEAMDYIYNRGAEAVAEGQVEIDTDEFKCQACSKVVNLHDEPAFIMGIWQAEEKIDQQRWCKACAVDELNYKIENH
jgi:hypothetical protein